MSSPIKEFQAHTMLFAAHPTTSKYGQEGETREVAVEGIQGGQSAQQ